MIEREIDDIINFIKDKRVWWEYHNNSFLGENGFWDLYFPQDWKLPLLQLEQLDLLDLATFGMHSKVYKSDWPDSLKDFIRNCYSLPLNRLNSMNLEKLKLKDKMQLSRGMSPKKLHEVESLGMV